ncbi:MAG: hypothetical protein KF894_15830 [Labilithrix sp.]|nr:hypothetical protein [Labilithrix sp.]
MSIENPDVVDFVAIEHGQTKIALAISSHWDWSHPLEHVYALQEKMNTYAVFIESGQVWKAASEHSGVAIAPGSIPIEIKVFLRCDPPQVFFDFMDRAREVFAAVGVSVAHEMRPG